ncbi:MAG: hypothetical protein JWM73_2422 [Solirubrobacterales bacterium]|nr:hypothetical protein [Solirubrobacterales bacterium]
MAAGTNVFETVSDPWKPRSDEWLGRGLSRYAGDPDRPVLIGACPRSGTTLLRGLLNNHPDLAIPGESNFIFYLWRHRGEFGSLRREKNRRRMAEWIFDSDGRGAKRIQGRSTREEAIQRMVDAEGTIGSVFAAGFELYAERHRSARWGDKRPGYAGFIKTMFELFPNAQFVNLIRDPRGAVASQLPLGWDHPEEALASSVATWETSIQRVDDHSEHLRPDQLIDVRFEDLVRDPRGEVTRICAWATLEADDKLITKMITQKRRGQFREGWHDKLNDEIDTSAVDSWRTRMEPAQIAFVEQTTGTYFERLGYRPLAGLDAAPDPVDLAELERQRARRASKWDRRAQEERRNRLRTLWAPVAARPTKRG